VEVQTNIYVQCTLTTEEYQDILASFAAVYTTYLRHFPNHLDEIAPLLAFKNVLVLGVQEMKDV
jgi:hypothetical protein